MGDKQERSEPRPETETKKGRGGAKLKGELVFTEKSTKRREKREKTGGEGAGRNFEGFEGFFCLFLCDQKRRKGCKLGLFFVSASLFLLDPIHQPTKSTTKSTRDAKKRNKKNIRGAKRENDPIQI